MHSGVPADWARRDNLPMPMEAGCGPARTGPLTWSASCAVLGTTVAVSIGLLFVVGCGGYLYFFSKWQWTEHLGRKH